MCIGLKALFGKGCKAFYTISKTRETVPFRALQRAKKAGIFLQENLSGPSCP